MRGQKQIQEPQPRILSPQPRFAEKVSIHVASIPKMKDLLPQFHPT